MTPNTKRWVLFWLALAYALVLATDWIGYTEGECPTYKNSSTRP